MPWYLALPLGVTLGAGLAFIAVGLYLLRGWRW